MKRSYANWTLVTLAAVALVTIVLWVLRTQRPLLPIVPNLDGALSATSNQHFCNVRTNFGGIETPIQHYVTVTSTGASTRHEPEQVGAFSQIKWSDNTAVVHIDRGNIGISMNEGQLNLLRGCVLDIQIHAKPSTAAIAVPRPLTDRWFRVSLKDSSAPLDHLSSWWHSQDSKKPTHFDVQGSTKDWENIIFPERAAICLNYETAAISVSANLAANYVGMDVDVSITRTAASSSPTKPSDVSDRWHPPGYRKEPTCIGKTLSKILESKGIDESQCEYHDFTPGLLSAIAMPMDGGARWLMVGFHPPPMDRSRKWSAASLEKDPIAWAYSRQGKPKVDEILLE